MSAQHAPLTAQETDALARRMVEVALDRVFDMGRISWEDLPELTESEWEAVTDAFEAYALKRMLSHDQMDESHDVDRRELWSRFS